MNLVFLDMDGVLNNSTFEKNFIRDYRRRNQVGRDTAYDMFYDLCIVNRDDGFLNGFIAPNNLKIWNEFIDKNSSFKVVFSSDWRFERFPTDIATLDRVKQLFQVRGIHGEVVGITDNIMKTHLSKDIDYNRCYEILQFIRGLTVEVENILVLDDISFQDELTDQLQELYKIHNFKFKWKTTNPKFGLTQEDVDSINTYFNL